MDSFTCTKCKLSTMGSDGTCINCGWDRVEEEQIESQETEQEPSSDDDESQDEDVESLDALIQKEYDEDENLDD